MQNLIYCWRTYLVSTRGSVRRRVEIAGGFTELPTTMTLRYESWNLKSKSGIGYHGSVIHKLFTCLHLQLDRTHAISTGVKFRVETFVFLDSNDLQFQVVDKLEFTPAMDDQFRDLDSFGSYILDDVVYV